jgi:hypothetical protein
MNTKQNIDIAIKIIDLNGGLINGLNGKVIAKFDNDTDFNRCYQVFVKSPLNVTTNALVNEVYVAV